MLLKGDLSAVCAVGSTELWKTLNWFLLQYTSEKIRSLRKSLGDSVCVHPIKNRGLRLSKLTTPPMMRLTARREMSVAEKGAVIVLFYLRYPFAVISLISG